MEAIRKRGIRTKLVGRIKKALRKTRSRDGGVRRERNCGRQGGEAGMPTEPAAF